MFWKKTTSSNIFFEYETSDKRASFRLHNEVLGPAIATYKSRIAQIIDISAGGISFECKDCTEGETGDLQLELPGKIIENVLLPTKIIKITDAIICHCKFIKIDTQEEEKIHQYILSRQLAAKRKLRTARENKTDHE